MRGLKETESRINWKDESEFVKSKNLDRGDVVEVAEEEEILVDFRK